MIVILWPYKKVIFALLLSILIPATVLAWDDCPKEEVLCDDECGLFVDTDNDGICDRSQLAPEDRNGSTADAKITEYEIEEINELATSKELKTKTENKQSERIYHLMPISLFLIILYFITHILSRKKIITVVNHRKFWNIFLLVTFLISGILGILLVVEINLGITIPLPFNILFWHVEAGIAMFAISIFHTLWHWAYFKNLFMIKKDNEKAN